MLFYNSLSYSILISILLIIINFKIFSILQNKLKIEKNVSNLIYFLSLIFVVFYLLNDILSLLKISPGSDSISYYFNAEQKILYEKIPLIPGHNFLLYLTYSLKLLSFDFISINFLFGILTSVSKLIFYYCISKFFTNTLDKYLILLFIFLPSYNFWSSGISKDTLTIFLFSLFLFSFVKNNFKFFLIALLFLSFIRLHLFYIVTLTFLLTTICLFTYSQILKQKIFLFDKELSDKNFILLFLSGFILFLIIGYFFYNEHIFNLLNVIKHFQNMYPENNFIESTKFFERIFEYNFRPFILDTSNYLLNILKIENVLLLVLFLILILKSLYLIFTLKKINLYKIDLKIFILLSFISIAIFQILLTSNYGIAIRQKWSYLPGIIFLLYYFKFFLSKNSLNK